MPDEVVRRCKYFEIRREPSSLKTHIYVLVNLRANDIIGRVYWYGRWRQYCFFPLQGTVWSAGCLAEVRDFVAALNNHTSPLPTSDELIRRHQRHSEARPKGRGSRAKYCSGCAYLDMRLERVYRRCRCALPPPTTPCPSRREPVPYRNVFTAEGAESPSGPEGSSAYSASRRPVSGLGGKKDSRF